MKINLRTSILTGAAFVTIAFTACRTNCIKGSGNSTSINRKVENFTKIKVSGDYKIVFKQDSSLSLNITGDDNVLENIRTDVSGGQLTIDSKRNICSKNQVVVVVGFKQLEKIDGSGAIEFTSDGKLNLADLDLNLAGSTKTDLDINAGNLSTESAGSSDIKLKGQASSHSIKVAGNGDLNALDFVVSKYDIDASGAFDAEINVLNELNTKSTGAADIKYRGNPKSVNTSKTGASSVKKID
jgi:hypothetical protein